MGYEVLKRVSGITCDYELFPEVMRSVSLLSLFKKFSRTLPEGNEISNGE